MPQDSQHCHFFYKPSRKKRVHSEGSSCQKLAYFQSQTGGQSCIFSLGMFFQVTRCLFALFYIIIRIFFFFFNSPNIYKNKKNRTNCKCSLIVSCKNYPRNVP